MSYFVENYPSFKYPLKEDDTPGFRPAQIAAINSAAAHFVTRNDPGTVTMPTRASRSLIVPTRVVISSEPDIHEEMRSVSITRKMPSPRTSIPELQRAMGLSDDYSLPLGTRRDRITMPGNGICAPVMETVIGAPTTGNQS